MKLKQLHTFFLRCQFLAFERHNLHDDLCLVDPPVMIENVMYGSDEFNDKIDKEIILCIIPNRAENSRGGAWPPSFCVAKKNEKQRGKRLSKQKLLLFNNVCCLILNCLEVKYFSVFHHRSLWNPFGRPCQI